MSTEIPIELRNPPLSSPVSELAAEGLRRAKAIDCFDFVPSHHEIVYRALEALPRGRYCEWGSGIGINVGIAAMLGFEAVGIEIDPRLADGSRKLLHDFALDAAIHTGSYYEIPIEADYYFVYCWASHIRQVEAHFLAVAPPSAKLLICDGAEKVRCKVKAGEGGTNGRLVEQPQEPPSVR